MIDSNINSKRIFKSLANLQFAISMLFLIGFIIAIGTIIEQDQPLTFYQENYTEARPLLGFLNWKIITTLNLNKIYNAWWFFSILALFGSSLLACTFTTQLPSLKTFKIWKFVTAQKQYENLNIKNKLDLKSSNSLAYNCNDNNYHFFRQQKKGYAYSGLLGRVGPIIVHGSIILLLIGSTIGSFRGYNSQEIVPRGEIFHIQNLTNFGNISYISQDVSCRINDFWITYTKDFKTDQFYSDLSILDSNGKELKRKVIYVNEPLAFNNLVLYQTDWDIIGLKLRLNNNQTFQIPLKKITKNGQKFWFGSLNLFDRTDSNLTFVINNLTDNLFLYDAKGVLIKEFQIGKVITINENIQLQVLDSLTSTGLQIKSDPGIPVVYVSFLLLMVSIYVSFFSYSQIWSFEKNSSVLIGGKSNRAVLFFQEEFRKILKRAN